MIMDWESRDFKDVVAEVHRLEACRYDFMAVSKRLLNRRKRNKLTDADWNDLIYLVTKHSNITDILR